MAQREWVPVYTSLLTSRKYRLLSLEERGAWLHVLLFACLAKPEGVVDRDVLAIELGPACGRTPESIIDRLVEVGLLDSDGSTLTIHDRDQWQKGYRGPSDDPEYKAAYMRDYRAKRGSTVGDRGSTVGVSGIEERRGEEGEETRGEETPAYPWDANDQDPYMVACQRLGFIPQSPDFAGEWDALSRTFGPEVVIEAIGRTKPTRKPWDLKKEAEMILVSERRRRSRSTQRLAEGSTRSGQDPSEIARIMEQNRESAREARKGLLLAGTVAPTRPGDEDLLREAKEEADAGRD